MEYERLDVDCVLFSTTGGSLPNDLAFAAEAQGHATSNRYWISFSVLARDGLTCRRGSLGTTVNGPHNAQRMEHAQLPSPISTTIEETLHGLGGERLGLAFTSRIWWMTYEAAVAINSRHLYESGKPKVFGS